MRVNDGRLRRAPSTMLRMVPLPRFAWEEKAPALSSPAEGGGGGPSEGRWRGQAPNLD